MPRRLKFSKMHGAGNDFVILDSRDFADLKLTQEIIAELCQRRTGIGADGLIVIDSPTQPKAAFRMVYFNADGQEAEMCGNGARCSVAFAFEKKLTGETCFFETHEGLLSGRVFGPQDIQISLPAWKNLELDFNITGSKFPNHHACNTGVPHLIIPVDNVNEVDVLTEGQYYRQHDFFSPQGTNVNFVSRAPEDGHWNLRTYERGVENETLACGTGASATAVVLCKLGLTTSPVILHTRGGDKLEVGVDFQNQQLLLRGPAITSFRGETRIHE